MRKRLIPLLSLLLLSSVPRMSPAQATEEDRRSPGPGPIVVTLDLRTGEVGSALPFDEPFILKAEDPSKAVAGVALSIFEANEPFEVVRCGKTREPECGNDVDEGWMCVKGGSRKDEDEDEDKAAVHPRKPTADSSRQYRDVECTFLRDAAWSLPPLESKEDATVDFLLHVPELAHSSHHQLLVLYRLRPPAPEEKGVLARFRAKAVKVITKHFAKIDPQADPRGSFEVLQKALHSALVTLARDHGLEVIEPDHPLHRWSEEGLTAEGLGPRASLEKAFLEATSEAASPLVSAQLRLRRYRRPDCRTAFDDLREARAQIRTIGGVVALESGVKAFLEEPPPSFCESADPAEVKAAGAAFQQLGKDLGAAAAKAATAPNGEALSDALEAAEKAASSLAATASLIAGNLREIQEVSLRLAESFLPYIAQTTVFARASTISTFETRAKWQISGDFGVAWATEIEEALPFLGTNFYTRPVNKQAALPSNPFKEPRKRLSLAVGLVLTDVGDGRTRAPLFDTGDFSLLLGGGWRLTDSIRLGAGAVVFKKVDPDPLVDETSTTHSPYVSLAIDWDLRSLVQWMQRLWPNS